MKKEIDPSKYVVDVDKIPVEEVHVKLSIEVDNIRKQKSTEAYRVVIEVSKPRLRNSKPFNSNHATLFPTDGRQYAQHEECTTFVQEYFDNREDTYTTVCNWFEIELKNHD